MKTGLTILASVVLMIMTACTSGQMVAGPNVSIYTEIPMAPNVILTVEVPVISSPGPSYIWVDGYWTWDYRYREYVWVQGYWALAPYEGAFWIPGYWEYYRGGYRWIDACWLPRNYQFRYGYYNGRYDYYGRPVYYDRPRSMVNTGYAYAYDNRPEYRSKGYNSSPSFNNAPKSERTRINREYQQQTRNSAQSVSTDRNRQETIRIRENGDQRNRESTIQKRPGGTEENQIPATTSPSRIQPDNNRQNAGSVKSNESRSPGNNELNISRTRTRTPSENRTQSKSRTQSESRVRESSSSSSSSASPGHSSNATSSPSRSSGSSSNSRSSSTGSDRR